MTSISWSFDFITITGPETAKFEPIKELLVLSWCALYWLVTTLIASWTAEQAGLAESDA